MKYSTIRFVFFLILITILSSIRDQLYSQPVILGIRGGIGIPELKGGGTPQSSGYSSRLAPNFGAFINYKFNPEFSLEAELLFSGQGGQRNGMQAISSDNLSGFPLPPNTNLYANFNNETILNYLEIPILAGYTFNGGNKGMAEYIDAGPYVGILLNAETKTSGYSQIYFDQTGRKPLSIYGLIVPPQNFNNESNVTSSINKLDLGITGGIGVNINIGSDQLNFDIRGSYGFIPVESNKSDGSNNTGALYITIGYGIHV